MSWLWSRQGGGDDDALSSADYVPLGYYLSDASILGTDDEGRTLYRIWAGSAEEMPEERRLVLRDVIVEYEPGNDVPWVLTASSGEAPIDETYLDLNGGVELTTGEQATGHPTIIRTEHLRLEPQEFLAETDEPVSVFIGERRLDAVGMKADLKADNLALESNVHGQFRP